MQTEFHTRQKPTVYIGKRAHDEVILPITKIHSLVLVAAPYTVTFQTAPLATTKFEIHTAKAC